MTRSASDRAAQPADEPRIEIVDLLGETPAAAIEQLRQLDLVPALEEQDANDAASDRLVVGQDPGAGEAARRGDVVTLVVGRVAHAANEPTIPDSPPIDDAGDDWYELPATLLFSETDLDDAAGRDDSPSTELPAPAVRSRWWPVDWRRSAVGVGGALIAATLVVVALRGGSPEAAVEPRVQTVIETAPARPIAKKRGTLKPRAKRRPKRVQPHRASRRPSAPAQQQATVPSRVPTPSPRSELPPAPPTPCELCFEHP
ncbi:MULTISPECIES: PASTA domain-containing protein [unclassified Conexibacter]|uniref:PASTA domain-containing protein n=1 Tax=unclassified Conexibacter TaxID=2627773 RepID=UPI00351C9B12